MSKRVLAHREFPVKKNSLIISLTVYHSNKSFYYIIMLYREAIYRLYHYNKSLELYHYNKILEEDSL